MANNPDFLDPRPTLWAWPDCGGFREVTLEMWGRVVHTWVLESYDAWADLHLDFRAAIDAELARVGCDGHGSPLPREPLGGRPAGAAGSEEGD